MKTSFLLRKKLNKVLCTGLLEHFELANKAQTCCVVLPSSGRQHLHFLVLLLDKSLHFNF